MYTGPDQRWWVEEQLVVRTYASGPWSRPLHRGHGWAVWHGFLQDRWLDRQRSIINVVPSDNKPVMFISMFPSWQYSLFYRIRIRSLLLLTDETISSALPLNATNLLEFSGCQLKEPYGLPQDKVGINLLRVPGGLPP